MAESVVALQSFVGKINGVQLVFRNGDLISSDHAAVKKWPQFFGPVVTHHEIIETATAAPGQKRGK